MRKRKAKPHARCAGCGRVRYIHIPRLALCRGCWERTEEGRAGIGRGRCKGEVPDFLGPARTPALPCPALPGSAGKVEEMARRAERGESLFRRDDGRGCLR